MDKNEYTLTKEDIANYLYDFSYLMSTVCLNKDVSFWINFVGYMRSTNRYMYASQYYYMEMIEVFGFYLMKSINSILYDANFKSVLPENIDINKNIFVNPNDASMFPDKKWVIRYIRNVINHSDNKEQYQLKRINNKIYIEIDIADSRTKKEKAIYTDPRPFHVLISCADFYELMSKALTVQDLNHYVLDIKKDLSSLNSKNCFALLDNVEMKKVYPKDNPTDPDVIKTFSLTYSQKRKIQQDLKGWEKLLANGRAILPYLVMTAMPLPELKRFNYETMLYFVGQYLILNKNKSMSDFEQEVQMMLLFDEKNILFENVTNEFGTIPNKLCAVYDWDLFSQISCFIYCGYIFDTVVNDEKITIGKKEYPRNKLRNSFVHSRWVGSYNTAFEFFDWKNDFESEYNDKSSSYWREIITWNNLEDVAKEYHDKICHNHLISYPMCIRSGIYSNQYSEFSFTESGILWRLVTNGSFDNQNELPWGIYCFDQNNRYFIDDEEKIEYFLSKIYEMSDCSEDEKDLIYFHLKKCNKITRDYYNNLLDKEEATEKIRQSFDDDEENNKTLKK